MKIIKKDFRKEEFDFNKIKTSILNSASDINFPLTEFDTKTILRSIIITIEKLHKDDKTTNVYEVRSIIYTTLREFGFIKIANSYMNI